MAGDSVTPTKRSSEIEAAVSKSEDEKGSKNAGSDAPRKISLRSSDGEMFEIEEAVAMQSETIKMMIDEDECASNAILPLPNVTGETLAKIIEYCRRQADLKEKMSDDDVKKWEEEFVKQFDKQSLFEVTLASNYLNVKELLNLLCQTIADTIEDMGVEDVRIYMNEKNDYTSEEEEKVRQENAWAFQ